MTDKTNDVALLEHLNPIQGISRYTFCIETAFSYFPHNVEDENFISVSYLCDWASKVSYVIALSHRSDFQDTVPEYFHAPRFVNDFDGGAKHILTVKSPNPFPILLIKKMYRSGSFGFLQTKGPLVIISP